MLYVWIILQIILESLPVSSSGHVALMQRYCGTDMLCADQLVCIDFLLHGPMIVILLLFFFRTWWGIVFHKPLSFDVLFHASSWMNIMKVCIFGLIADGITVSVWYLDFLPTTPLLFGFMITALLLYMTRYTKILKDNYDASDYRYAVALGIMQSLSFLPGISRFGSTYAVGRFCGYSGKIAFAISFLIQFPLLVAAFLKGIVTVRQYPHFMTNFFDFRLVFVILIASVISYGFLYFVDKMIVKNKLWQFSWYMLIPIVTTLMI